MDKSTTFTNVEISKKIGEKWKVQLESSAKAAEGSAFTPAPENKSTPSSTSIFFRPGTIRYQSLSYEAPVLSHEYSMKRTALTVGYNFLNGDHFGLTLSGGVSVYDYSVATTMPGTVNVYRHFYEVTQTTNSGNVKVNSVNQGDTYEGTVTNKQFLFDYSAVGAYISIEPRYDFNSHFAVSARLTASSGKKASKYLLTGAEAGLRCIYKPIKHLELYTGYEAWHITNDLDSSVDPDSPSDKDLGHSDLSIDARGFVGGIALRF
ncbi:MAG: hypothetical protein EOO07_18080 [Chitinophagaceae bacterium]|nr:MAG: hypothetical protein EOO07_18080 [Chitinophagaceae bacterium]